MSNSAGRGYRDMQVWRRSMAWTVEGYRASAGWPAHERHGLTSQVRRAAVSVAANIAEGAARRTPGEFLDLLSNARGSLAEAETLLLLSAELSYTSQQTVEPLLAEADQIGRMLAGLKQSLAGG